MGCAATLRALRLVTGSSSGLSSRARCSVWATCTSLRASPSLQRGQSAARLGAQSSSNGTAASAAAGLLAWESIEAAPAPPQYWAVACKSFLQDLAHGPRPSEEEYNKLMADLCESNNFGLAWKARCAAMRAGLRLRYNGCQRLVSLAVKVGDLPAALEAFDDLKASGLTPNKVTYCCLISALGRDRRRGVRSAALAYELWRELQGQGETLDAAAYRAGMNACIGVGQLEEAQVLLKSVAKAGEARDVRAYNILLKHHSRAGDAAALRRLLSRMDQAGVRPSSVTHNILVDGYVRAGDMAEAHRAMERAAAAGVRLDAWCYTSLVKGYVQGGALGAAEGIVVDMCAAGVAPTAVTYSTLVDGYVRAGDLAAALRTLRVMSAAGQAPTVVTYNTLLRGYAAAFSGEGGGSAGGQGAAAAAAAGGLVAALELLETMQQRGVAPTTDTFNTLMSAAVAGGQPQLAVEVHERMVAAGLRPDALTYTTLLQAYSRTDRLQEAMAVFETLCKDSNVALDVAAYNAAVHVLCRAGEMEAAERLAQAAARLAQKQGQPAPMEAYGALVAGYARLRQVSAAVDAVRRYHAAGGTPDVRMLEALADASVRVGEYKVAMQTVRAMELLGHPVEKAKYKALVQTAIRRQEQRAARNARQRAGAARLPTLSGHDSSGSAAGPKGAAAARRQHEKKSIHLERFKFWLGLPNSYYNSSLDVE